MLLDILTLIACVVGALVCIQALWYCYTEWRDGR